MIYGLILAAIFIGIFIPVQAGINSQLTRYVQHPFLGAFISFSTGALVLGIIILIRGVPWTEIKKLPSASPHLFLGGALGALFVASSIYFIPKMGATTMIAAFVTGQLLGSVIMDHFGLFGLVVHPLNLTRFLGIFLLFAGLMLVVR